MKILGIDEAGRGPAIGPLVIAGAMVAEKDLDKIKNMGATDSKALTPLKREKIFDELIAADFVTYDIRIISSEDVDKAVESANFNLNWLEAVNSAIIINKLKCDKAILDCPSNNIKAYSDYVMKNLIDKCKIVAEHKADATYPIVGAASILAKVTRDRAIEKIKKEVGFDFGSGYASDPFTVNALKEKYKDPKFSKYIRKSWQSYKNLIESKIQKGLNDF